MYLSSWLILDCFHILTILSIWCWIFCLQRVICLFLLQGLLVFGPISCWRSINSPICRPLISTTLIKLTRGWIHLCCFRCLCIIRLGWPTFLCGFIWLNFMSPNFCSFVLFPFFFLHILLWVYACWWFLFYKGANYLGCLLKIDLDVVNLISHMSCDRITTRNSRFYCEIRGFCWKFSRKSVSYGFRYPRNTFVSNCFHRILGSARKVHTQEMLKNPQDTFG